MPRRRLELLWRFMVGIYVVVLATILAARASPDALGPWPTILGLLAVAAAVGTVIWLRPRPVPPPHGHGTAREAAQTLRALRRGQPAGPAEQRAFAIDVARSNLFAATILVPVWSSLGLNIDAGTSWSRFLGVVGLVGCGIGLLAARWRMAQLDRWEHQARDTTTPDSTTTSTTSEGHSADS